MIQSYLRGDRSLEREIDGALSPGRCRGCSYCELQVDARVRHLVFAWVRFGLFATDVIAIFQSVNYLAGLFSYQAVVADYSQLKAVVDVGVVLSSLFHWV